MKTCSKCKEEKPNTAEYFFRDSRKKDRLRNDCKVCKGENLKNWYKSKGPEYMAWKSLKSRCYNPNNDRYEHYGGRNIKVCQRWLDSYDNFLEDLGERPSKNHSINRIDNDGDYEPSNCEWATRYEQSINKGMQSNNTSGTVGVKWSKTRNKWDATIGKHGKRYHLGSHENIEDAIAARKAAEVKYWNKETP